MRLRDKVRALFYLKKNQGLLEASEVFCMAPWVNLHAQPDGHAYPCCISCFDKKNAVGNFHDTPEIESMWNSDGMKKLRTAMLKGEESRTCKNCYEYDRIGKFSERKQFNRDYAHHFGRVNETLSDGSCTRTEIISLDIRFSNQCNYKCRICNSEPSSLWREDAIELGVIDESYPKLLHVAPDDQRFWNSFVSALPYVEKVHFAGGEPLFMEEHYKTLEQLIAINKTEVHLSYNTNFSTLRFKKNNVLDLWAKFKTVHVFASLDGIGTRGDYQRKGQRWETVEKNILELKERCPHVYLGIDATVSVFNIFHIPDFYKYMVENKFIEPDRMNLYLLFDPHYFSIKNLSTPLKQKAIKLYDDFISGYLKSHLNTEKMQEHSAAVIRHMVSEDYNAREELKKQIEDVDAIRKEKFADIFPEISELISI